MGSIEKNNNDISQVVDQFEILVDVELEEYAVQKIKKDNFNIKKFKEHWENASDEELRIFIPNVYQKNIYRIDYLKLWERGIRLLTFDIDDTIDDSIVNKVEGKLAGKIPFIKVTVPKEAVDLFNNLKEMGFTVGLLTNGPSCVAKAFYEQLEANDYIARANKPEVMAFEEMRRRHNMDKSQMAHIGNSMWDDVQGGNLAGIVTCYVRRNGFTLKVAKKTKNMFGTSTRGQIIRKQMLERNLWRKHHFNEKEDQYYQLNETPQYYK